MPEPNATLEELEEEEARLRMELELAREIEQELLRIFATQPTPRGPITLPTPRDPFISASIPARGLGQDLLVSVQRALATGGTWLPRFDISLETGIRTLLRSSPEFIASFPEGLVEEMNEYLSGTRAGVVERPPVSESDLARLASELQGVQAALGGALDFILPGSIDLPGWLEKLSGLLLKPSYVPGEPCLAPAPLLRDLLDIALGKITGGLDAVVTQVGQSVWDFLLPAGVEGEGLGHFVESILADPVTAALNWILGKQAQIECVVTGGLSVGEGVLETQVRRLEEAVAGVFP